MSAVWYRHRPLAVALFVCATVGQHACLRSAAAQDNNPPNATHKRLDIRGWTVWLNRSVRESQPNQTSSALRLLDGQLKRIIDAVPSAALAELRQVPIWVNPQYPGESPRCEYHPGAGWLKRNGRDPRMAKAVEISDVSQFEFENRRMPYLMLHELAHAYHDRVLGFNHAEIEAAYEQAAQNGLYKRVQRFTGKTMVEDKAYALTNAKEYFAECSEAFFGRNDFFPFDLTELQEYDPRVVDILHQVWMVDSEPQPLVHYRPEVQNYLKRIQSGKNEFGFREDWPGGFAQWQNDARSALIERVGLKRIRDDLKGFVPVVRLGEPEACDGFTRTRCEIQTEPDRTIPFYWLVPQGEGPFPMALCPHGHSDRGWHAYAGIFTDDEDRQDVLMRQGNIAEQLAKKGFVTVAPATRGLAKETLTDDVNGRHGKRACRAQFMHCIISGRTAVGERVWDMQRILDWAIQQPVVDKSRIAMLGNSGGGVVTAYAAAIDERIGIAIPSCSFTSVTSSTGYIFHCDCCAIPGMLDWGDLSDVGGLIAPRALLIVHGPQDSLHHRPDVQRNTEQVQKIFTAAGAEDRLSEQWGDAGHQFYPDIMWQFLDRQW